MRSFYFVSDMFKNTSRYTSTHYNWNWNSRSMTHCITGHVICVDTIHENYRFQKFLLKLSRNVKNKCETLMSFSADKSVFKIIVLSMWNNVQLTKLWMNSVSCNVPIVLTVPIITNTVARWQTMHVSRLQNVRSIHGTQNWRFYYKKIAVCNEEIKTVR